MLNYFKAIFFMELWKFTCILLLFLFNTTKETREKMLRGAFVGINIFKAANVTKTDSYSSTCNRPHSPIPQYPVLYTLDTHCLSFKHTYTHKQVERWGKRKRKLWRRKGFSDNKLVEFALWQNTGSLWLSLINLCGIEAPSTEGLAHRGTYDLWGVLNACVWT